jgi:hypothetical protein
MRSPHTSCPRGKRVRIVMRSGEIIIDKFVDRTSRFIVLEEYGRLASGSVCSFAILKRC